MLARAHGDTLNFRADRAVAPLLVLLLEIVRRSDDVRPGPRLVSRVPRASSVPALELPQLLADEAELSGNSALETLTEDAAMKLAPLRGLTSSSCWISRASFEKLRDDRHEKPDHRLARQRRWRRVMWIEGVMPYLRRPSRSRTGSTYRKRVAVANPDKRRSRGRRGRWSNRTLVSRAARQSAAIPRQGVYVVGRTRHLFIGRGVQQRDAGFPLWHRSGRRATASRANLSGGVRRTTLTHCGLIVAAPRFTLNRPSGATRARAVYGPRIRFDGSQPLRDSSI